jgi:hypothetical protein
MRRWISTRERKADGANNSRPDYDNKEREWLAEIIAGTKKIEYRQIKPYWTKRFGKVSVPFELRLLNGMNPPVPEVTVLIHKITKNRRAANTSCISRKFWDSSTGTSGGRNPRSESFQNRAVSIDFGRRTRLLGVAVIFVTIAIFFFAVFLLILLFLVGLLPKEDIGISPRNDVARILGLALVPIELLLEARLRIGSPREGTHGNLKFPAAKCADSDGRSGAQPFDDLEAALDHGHFFLRVWHSALLG